MAVVAAAPLPPQPLFQRFARPRPVLVLLLLMWLPLVAYVMFGRAARRPAELHPASRGSGGAASLFIAVWAWRELPIAIVGLTLVFFWLVLAVTAPYLPLIDPNKPVAPFVTPFTEKNGVMYWLGTDYARPRHALAHHLGLPARHRLGRSRRRLSPTSSEQ